MPDVAVVAVTANSGPDARRMLDDVRAQRDVDLEVVAVDNGSRDGTLPLLERAPDVHVIANGRNRWLAPAWMQGVRESTAPYLLFLTPDLRLPQPEAVARLKDALEADLRAAVAGPALVDEEGRDLGNGRFAWPSPRWVVASALGFGRLLELHRPPPAPSRREQSGTRPVRFVNGGCMLVRRRALEAVGGLDERYRLYWEEIDLARRLGAAGFRILLVPQVLGVHRGKGSPAGPGLRESAYAYGERLYFRTHHGYGALAAVTAARAVERLRRRTSALAADRPAD